MQNVTIYTDGSAPDNAKGHGRGGWCAILVSGDHEKVLSGPLDNTTNNLAELTAVLEAFKALRFPCNVTVVTDSKLVIGWIYGYDTALDCPDPTKKFKRKDFECAKISKKIDDIIANDRHVVTFQHVKGHNGHEFNERCDVEARKQSDSLTTSHAVG